VNVKKVRSLMMAYEAKHVVRNGGMYGVFILPVVVTE
jgi:hypothetical protein